MDLTSQAAPAVLAKNTASMTATPHIQIRS
jgi:hypothetical protein